MIIEEKVTRKICDVAGCGADAYIICGVCGIDLCGGHEVAFDLQTSWYFTGAHDLDLPRDLHRDFNKTVSVCETCLDLVRAEFKTVVEGALARLQNLFGGPEAYASCGGGGGDGHDEPK